MREYQICARCIMDTSDPEIQFDALGVCSHCRRYDALVREHVFSGPEGERRLEEIVARIRKDGVGRDYDCVIGVSGGVDSTYVAYKVRQLGLRPLAVHLDNGWNSELAVKNIENVLRQLGIDLVTRVLDWDEFRDLQTAFLLASTPDSEIPSDHAIFSMLHRTAARYRLKHVVTGFNVRTESHMPAAWSQGHMDWKYIRSVHAQFGTRKLRSFPHLSLFQLTRYRWVQQWTHVLNFLGYVKADAMRLLESELGWKYYGGKHYESIYTRFYQGYILPTKFGFDKRRAHLSSLVCSGEITREHALEEIGQNPYPADLLSEDRAYVIKKLGLSEDKFGEIMRLPLRSYWDFPSYGQFIRGPLYRAPRAVYRRTLKPLLYRTAAA